MNLHRKCELAEQVLALIARHDDESVAVRNAAFERLFAFVDLERKAMSVRSADREQAKVSAILNKGAA